MGDTYTIKSPVPQSDNRVIRDTVSGWLYGDSNRDEDVRRLFRDSTDEQLAQEFIESEWMQEGVRAHETAGFGDDHTYTSTFTLDDILDAFAEIRIRLEQAEEDEDEESSV